MFDSLKEILPALERQPGWEEYRRYRQILECWQQTVNSTTVKHARPVYFKKDTLWVATSSSAWSQEVSLQRYALLKKLNTRLPFKIKDIRCSTSQWHQKNKQQDETFPSPSLKQAALNPFKKSSNSEVVTCPDCTSQAAKATVRKWLKLVTERSQALPLCPQCSVPTPAAELERWQQCHHCIAQKRAKVYRPIEANNNNNKNRSKS